MIRAAIIRIVILLAIAAVVILLMAGGQPPKPAAAVEKTAPTRTVFFPVNEAGLKLVVTYPNDNRWLVQATPPDAPKSIVGGLFNRVNGALLVFSPRESGLEETLMRTAVLVDDIPELKSSNITVSADGQTGSFTLREKDAEPDAPTSAGLIMGRTVPSCRGTVLVRGFWPVITDVIMTEQMRAVVAGLRCE
ncbi:hypothetical protein A3C96_03950 [Candidatus Uhrbacteria bacterium RIFCSPHIGHO2_02_FULL_60_10]|uniref:Uncharacterized protein n=1 Tax=Candidatus Uhrbacteria bacterium RIFCSPHIGHO2_02_FULL_60_10 TaxID=1802392 RepID=A0A1F7U2B7_9BACT|nr:MAG: hypothetical protein A3C96_03950 [Candidatus Uhrbacteria bacterium RIFCSPHIGHO2_02_FULL_60_10]